MLKKQTTKQAWWCVFINLILREMETNLGSLLDSHPSLLGKIQASGRPCLRKPGMRAESVLWCPYPCTIWICNPHLCTEREGGGISVMCARVHTHIKGRKRKAMKGHPRGRKEPTQVPGNKMAQAGGTTVRALKPSCGTAPVVGTDASCSSVCCPLGAASMTEQLPHVFLHIPCISQTTMYDLLQPSYLVERHGTR